MGVKVGPGALRLSTFTETGPGEAASGTTAMICVLLQLVTAAVKELNMTVLFPCVATKPLPVIVTGMPIGPLLDEMELMERDPSAVNWTPLLVTPPAVTVTGPLVALDGTATVMLASLQELTLAVTLLN